MAHKLTYYDVVFQVSLLIVTFYLFTEHLFHLVQTVFLVLRGMKGEQEAL